MTSVHCPSAVWSLSARAPALVMGKEEARATLRYAGLGGGADSRRSLEGVLADLGNNPKSPQVAPASVR
ncbi:hypothetical protein WAI453_010354 [Rhynchosporium graminicola]